MINEPSVDELVRKLGTDDEPVSRYELCVVASKRTRQIIEQMQSSGNTELPGKQKEIVLACKEIMSGKVKCSRD